MEGEYPIFANGQSVGTVQVYCAGLYYEFVCRCRQTHGQMQELVVRIGDSTEKLGLLVPSNSGWQLRKRVPIKRLGEGKPLFLLRSRNEQTAETVEIDAEKPFPFLERLDEAYLVSVAGESRIAFRKTEEKRKLGLDKA